MTFRVFLLLLPALLTAQADRFPLPACTGPDHELVARTAFILCHSATLIGKVAVPTHLYKAILIVQEDSKTVFAAIIPNQPAIREPLPTFTVTLPELEARTSLHFFEYAN